MPTSTAANTEEEHTDFGFQRVPTAQKPKLVEQVFSSVAARYDVMNDLMSFGLHRLWKKFAVGESGLRPGQQVLDVAAGSGDLSRHFAAQVTARGRVVLSDSNADMLARGRTRMLDAGLAGNIEYVLAEAENLPFAAHRFHCVAIAFGLRNVTHKAKALASMYRVIRPGGRLLVLEFSRPRTQLLASAYDAYSFNVIPRLGKWVADDEASYRYLVESIRRHPPQESLRQSMLAAGFATVKIFNLSGGIVALHVGYKF